MVNEFSGYPGEDRRMNLCFNCDRIQKEHKELSDAFYTHSDRQIKKDADCDMKMDYLEEISKENKIDIKTLVEDKIPPLRSKVFWVAGVLSFVGVSMIFCVKSYISIADDLSKHAKADQKFEVHLSEAPTQLKSQRKTELDVAEIKININNMKSDIKEIKQLMKEISGKIK